jgi:hypothetical protein
MHNAHARPGATARRWGRSFRAGNPTATRSMRSAAGSASGRTEVYSGGSAPQTNAPVARARLGGKQFTAGDKNLTLARQRGQHIASSRTPQARRRPIDRFRRQRKTQAARLPQPTVKPLRDGVQRVVGRNPRQPIRSMGVESLQSIAPREAFLSTRDGISRDICENKRTRQRRDGAGHGSPTASSERPHARCASAARERASRPAHARSSITIAAPGTRNGNRRFSRPRCG